MKGLAWQELNLHWAAREPESAGCIPLTHANKLEQ